MTVPKGGGAGSPPDLSPGRRAAAGSIGAGSPCGNAETGLTQYSLLTKLNWISNENASRCY